MSGYPTNSKFIQMLKKGEQNDKKIAEWLFQRQNKELKIKKICDKMI